MRIPARCNKRECQARRNLSKRPQLYVRWPRCHLPGCSGRMYVDEYRLRKGPNDKAPKCHENCLPYPHRHDTKGCMHYDEYILDRAVRGRVTNSPVKEDGDPPF